ncbi:MAG: hypothetical protein ACRD0D_07970, partial [Acidimicrobiales bacterium]
MALVFLSALAAGVFRHHLFAGYTFPWDFASGFGRVPVFVTSTFGSGRFTEWNPFGAGGMPIAWNLQAGLYFPLWWLMGLLHVPATVWVVTFVQVLHVVFGAFGVYLLARARGIAWPWPLVAAVPYLFFGGYYGSAEHADIFRGIAYAPWILWALTLPRDGRPWRRPLALPLLTWILATGAYPGQLVAFGLVAPVYAAMELWMGRRNHRITRTLGLVASVAVSSGAAVAAV